MIRIIDSEMGRFSVIDCTVDEFLDALCILFGDVDRNDVDAVSGLCYDCGYTITTDEDWQECTLDHFMGEDNIG